MPDEDAGTGWAALELATEASETEQRHALKNVLLANALKEHSIAPAFAPWRDAIATVAPNMALEIAGSLPVLTREALREAPENYRVPSVGPIRQVSTSGSSGRPLQFDRSRAEQDIERDFVNYAWLRMGVKPGSKGAVLIGRELPDGDHKVDSNGMLWISCTRAEDDVWRRVSELLEMHQPTYVRGYGSLVGEYFSFADRAGVVPSSLTGVAYSSDYMMPIHRDIISGLIGNPPIGLYGQSERVIMAATCERSDEYHVFDTYGHMEILDDDGTPINEAGQVGDVVGTSLWPRATALVRYRTGDRAAWLSSPCACGRTQPRFTLMAGRERDMLVDRQGERWVFGPAIYDPVAKLLPAGSTVQFSHPSPGVLRVRVTPLGSDTAKEMEQTLLDTLGTGFTVRVVDEPPVRTRAGKRLMLERPR